MFLDLKKFLDESYDKTVKRQVEIEQRFLQSEQSVSCLKPPRKKKKLNAPKQEDATLELYDRTDSTITAGSF